MKPNHLLFFLIIYISLFFLLFPGYRYVIDPDATGYFSVAEKVAKGDFHGSINGIWGPLGSWFLAPFMRNRFDPMFTVKYLNGLYGLLSLTAFFYLLKKLKIKVVIAIAMMSGAVFLILHFAFYRLFGDLLQLLFLLLYLNIICSKKFGSNYKGIILAAFIGGIAFYAKAYAFYFVLVHLPVSIYLATKNARHRISSQFIKKAITGIVVLFVTIMPWIIALNSKYGHYTLGEQNISGTLSTAYPQPRIAFYPPPSQNAYSIFDDISYLKIQHITPFTNGRIFVAQLKLIVFNILKTIEHFNDFSFAFILVILISLILSLGKNKRFLDQKNNLLLLSFIVVWPSGYLLFHVEPRFLWIMILAVLALAGVLLSYLMDILPLAKKNLYAFSLVIIFSFYLYPLIELKEQYGSGKNYFEMADALKQNNIKGNILYSNQSNGDLSKSVILNYLIKSKQYGPFIRDYTTQEILQAIQDYKINYFILYYSLPYQKEVLLNNAITSGATAVFKDIYPGVIVLKFN